MFTSKNKNVRRKKNTLKITRKKYKRNSRNSRKYKKKNFKGGDCPDVVINSMDDYNKAFRAAMSAQDRQCIKSLNLLKTKMSARQPVEPQVEKNPCEDTATGTVNINENCNGIINSITGVPIQNGYCLAKNCIDKKTLQNLRLSYIVPRENNYNRSDNKKETGALSDPFTNVIYSNEYLKGIGLEDPSAENAYMLADSDYNENVEKYREAIEQRNRFNKLFSKGKPPGVGFSTAP
jgi:hypothetical protein